MMRESAGMAAASLQLLHEFEVVIARNPENVPNTNLLQAAKQKISNRLFHYEIPVAKSLA